MGMRRHVLLVAEGNFGANGGRVDDESLALPLTPALSRRERGTPITSPAEVEQIAALAGGVFGLRGRGSVFGGGGLFARDWNAPGAPAVGVALAGLVVLAIGLADAGGGLGLLLALHGVLLDAEAVARSAPGRCPWFGPAGCRPRWRRCRLCRSYAHQTPPISKSSSRVTALALRWVCKWSQASLRPGNASLRMARVVHGAVDVNHQELLAGAGERSRTRGTGTSPRPTMAVNARWISDCMFISPLPSRLMASPVKSMLSK